MKLRYLFLSMLAVSGANAADGLRPNGFDTGEVRWKELGALSDDFSTGSLMPPNGLMLLKVWSSVLGHLIKTTPMFKTATWSLKQSRHPHSSTK